MNREAAVSANYCDITIIILTEMKSGAQIGWCSWHFLVARHVTCMREEQEEVRV